MKKIICAILACTLGVVSAASLAGCGCNSKKPQSAANTESKQSYEVVATQPDMKDDTYGFYILNDNELMITRYYGSLTDVVVPDSYQNYTVTTIGRSVFNNDGIKTVVLPETVTDIQDYAFSSNKNLTSIKLPSKLRHIGINAFFYCTGLESIELPASLETIDPFAFSAAGLKSIVIPESQTLTELPQLMFHQCPNLKEVVIPATITKIADDTFNECPADLTLKVAAGSYAEEYAKSHEMHYEAV